MYVGIFHLLQKYRCVIIFDMLDIYGTLEIERVLEEIASFSKTEIGIAKIKALKMLTEEEASQSLKL